VITLTDTTGTEVVRALSAERRSAGGVASGLALTLVTVVDEERVREAEEAAATAAAAHPCRLLIVVREPEGPQSSKNAESRLDAEIVVGGRLGPAEAVVMRMSGRLALHAESVVVPLLAPDVPVVTWWHGLPPDRIATDPLGVVAERRITEVFQSPDPIAALHQRAEDYAPGDTDLAWTRSTPWRAILAGALDTAMSAVSAVSITAAPDDPTAALLRGWLANRLRLEPAFHAGSSLSSTPRSQARSDVGDAPAVQRVDLRFTNGEEMGLHCENGTATLTRTGLPDRVMPLSRRLLGDQLAEELRRLDADQPYAAALQLATGVTGIADRPGSRVHIWYDPAGTP